MAGLPLLQQKQVYASSQQVPQSQSAAPPPPILPSPAQEQRPLSQVPPTESSPSQSLQSPSSMSTPNCNPKSPMLQLGSSGTKVAELQRILTQLGYGPLLGQRGIDGKFGPSTQNAVMKFQQNNRLQPVDGKVGAITWRALCYGLTLLSPSRSTSTTTGPTAPTNPANQQVQQTQQQSVATGNCREDEMYKDSSGRGHWVYNRGPWNFEYDIINGLGLVLYDIKAGDKHLFDSITVPQFGIEYFDNDGAMKSRIVRFCDPNGHSGTTTFSTLPRIISNGPRGIDYLDWTYYMRFNEQGNNVNNLLIGTLAIKYDLAIRWKPVTNCEASANECYRFVPKVTFLWIDGTNGNKRPVLNKFTAFYRLDYGDDKGIYPVKDEDSFVLNILEKGGGQPLLTKEHIFAAARPSGYGEIDNIHTASIYHDVVIPGCTTTAFDCVHMHWRWGDSRAMANYGIRNLDPMVEPSDDSPVSGQRGTHNLVPGQSIDIAIVTDNNYKHEPVFPDDPFVKAKDEQPIATTHDGYKVITSAGPIVWYRSSVEMEKTDTFFRHGIFVLKPSVL